MMSGNQTALVQTVNLSAALERLYNGGSRSDLMRMPVIDLASVEELYNGRVQGKYEVVPDVSVPRGCENFAQRLDGMRQRVGLHLASGRQMPTDAKPVSEQSPGRKSKSAVR